MKKVKRCLWCCVEHPMNMCECDCCGNDLTNLENCRIENK